MSDDTELDALAETFAEFLGSEWPREKAIAFAGSGAAFADELWSGMAGLGWTALTVPEESGGIGMDAGAAARLHAALGAAVAPAPMLGTLLAAIILGEKGGDLLSRVADGSLRVAVADPGVAPLVADGTTVSGTVTNLLDAAAANLFLLPGMTGFSPCWIVVEADAPGVSVSRHPLADTTRTLGDVTLSDVVIGEGRVVVPGDAARMDDALMRHACLALAADSLGQGEAVLAMTVEYMKTREQFGRLIGSFQALKHRVADHQNMLVGARELVMHAAGLADDESDALLFALSAKQHVARAVAEIARDCIQLHGGVGFTTEFAPHLYLKRAKLNEALFGTRPVLLDRVADMLEAA